MAISISVRDVSVRFDGFDALRRVSVDIPAGKIIGLLGPSGAGKTTLMRAVVGRQRVQKGSVEVLGRPAGSRALRGHIGYMPQSQGVYPDLTVQENMRYYAAMLRLGKREAADAIAAVDLAPQTKQLVRTLSGGQRSRLSLAIALLGSPELLVLDEPTVGVDPVLRQQLWNLFRGVAAQGTTLLVSSHVMDEATRCDDLLLIRGGELLAHDAPMALCEHTKTHSVEEAFLKLVEGAR